MKEEHKNKHDAATAGESKQKVQVNEPIIEKEPKLSEKEAREALKECQGELRRLAEELAKAKDEVLENKDKALRAMADQNNAAKRQHKEKEEFIKYASGEISRRLIPVLDDFENALKGEVKEDGNFVKGVKLIYGNLKEVLEKEGLKKQETLGKVFSPNLHEVVATEPTTKAEDEDVVAEEYRPGYMFKDFVLRPAMVKVFKKVEEAKVENADSENTAEQKEEGK